jgi:hypothetical protein
MSVETPSRSTMKPPPRLTLSLAALLLSHDGVLRGSQAATYARKVREESNTRRMPREMVTDAMRPLVRDNVVVRVGEDWYAPDLADLAAWIADGFDARDDAGVLDNPAIPGQRAA